MVGRSVGWSVGRSVGRSVGGSSRAFVKLVKGQDISIVWTSVFIPKGKKTQGH